MFSSDRTHLFLVVWSFFFVKKHEKKKQLYPSEIKIKKIFNLHNLVFDILIISKWFNDYKQIRNGGKRDNSAWAAAHRKQSSLWKILQKLSWNDPELLLWDPAIFMEILCCSDRDFCKIQDYFQPVSANMFFLTSSIYLRVSSVSCLWSEATRLQIKQHLAKVTQNPTKCFLLS